MIQFVNIRKAFGPRTLLENASFTMSPGERLALIGRNGSGKSTIFKLVLGEEEPDSGTITIPRGYRVGHLAQHLDFKEPTIVAEVMLGLPHDRQDEEYRAKIILAGLGFSEEDMDKPASQFSGGFQIRINLARLLLSEPNLLLLDEPTNYLDIISAHWLIEFLKEWPGELIVISHDRNFLDQVATHSMLIYRTGLRKMRGNTDDLYTQIISDEERYEQTRVNEERKRKEVEAFIDRFRAKASKAAQVQSRIKALERMGQKEALQEEETLEFRFRETPPFHGKFLLEAQDLNFSYTSGSSPIIKNLSLQLAAGDRLAIIGKNGRGKSTLLRLLAGELTPTSGSIRTSTHARVGYFGQTNINRLQSSLTVEDEVRGSNDQLSRTEVRGICGAMMFSGDDALKKISILSGGERSRVLLGKIIALPTNILLLDEPTNHLDMESIEALIDSCQNYSGALAIVTHSEHILRKLATKMVVFNAQGPLLVPGDYDYFLAKFGWDAEGHDFASASSDSFKMSSSSSNAQDPAFKKELKKLKKEMQRIEEEIVAMEKEVKKTELALAEASERASRDDIVSLSRILAELQTKIENSFSALEVADRNYRQKGGE